MEIFARYQIKIIEISTQVLFVIIFAVIALKVVRIVGKIIQKVIVSSAETISHEEMVEFQKRVSTIKGLLIAIADAIIYATLIFFFLGKIGIDVRPILAGAGILGLAVGFGAQELVRDIISGMFIIFENQIRKRDVAIINGTTGLVEKVGLRTITLRDNSGIVHVFQNGKINSLSNMTKDWSAMVFDISVSYKENVANVIKVMKDVGDELAKDPKFKKNILEPMEIMGLNEFSERAMVIKGRIKTKPIMQWSVGREYRKRLKEAFDEQGIEIPSPRLSVSWDSNNEPFQEYTK